MRVNPPQRKVPLGNREFFPEHSLGKTEHANFRRRIMRSEIDPERAAAVEEILAIRRVREVQRGTS